jgi:hypothetical protein
MANEKQYYDTPYTFINPVRYFKANDPYYYEVDNIPIKQLEESQNFLKDQVDGIITRQNNRKSVEIDRSGFSELLPYVTGNDRKVRVKPGKFTARINNAYNITPLQVISQIAGWSNTMAFGEVSDLNTWRVETNIGPYVTTVLQQFQDGLLGDALNMNGLAERAFTHPLWDDDGLFLGSDSTKFPRSAGTTSPGYGQFDGDLDPDSRPLFPNYIGAILKHSTPELTRDLQLIKGVYTEETQAGQQGRLESEFIKRWRGAIRTSIVDVPEELVISVPDFDAGDYYYIDSTGSTRPLAANQRIDLLFIYSKAVDEESTTIPKFDSAGNPTTLTQPALGILKGAGIGISRELGTNNATADDRVNLQTLDGTPIMLAHPGDEDGTNNGFTTSSGVIRGSFPSPDDLMNLAPVLSENLESTAFQLIGQSILPVAYVRVQTPAGPIADLLNNDDIIDIRPFFRTTELAYNERAGIAAATPQVSIANPVVTEAHLETVRKEMYSDLSNIINTIEHPETAVTLGGGGPDLTRIIATGQLTGGNFGAEGALMRHAAIGLGGGLEGLNFNNLADLIEDEFSYTPGSISQQPQWDRADWYTEGGFTGTAINDYINVGLGYCTEPNGAGGGDNASMLPPARGGFTEQTINEVRATYPTGIANLKWAAGKRIGFEQSFGNTTRVERAGSLPVNISNTAANTINDGHMSQIYFVKKRINLDFSEVSWASDYQVNVDLLNCIPLSQGAQGNDLPVGADYTVNNAQSSNIWVNKYKDYFVINVAWIGRSWPAESKPIERPWATRNDVGAFAGFTLPEIPIIGNFPFKGTPPKLMSLRNLLGTAPGRNNSLDYFNKVVNSGTASTEPGYASAEWLTALHPLLYPSVTFQVIGISEDSVERGKGNKTSLHAANPTISCT